MNDAPVTLPDSYTMNQDTITPLAVMNNDYDIDSAILTFTGIIAPAHGTLNVTGTGFTYAPNTGYFGNDSFTYQIEDESGALSNPSIVSLSIISTNVAPTAMS